MRTVLYLPGWGQAKRSRMSEMAMWMGPDSRPWLPGPVWSGPEQAERKKKAGMRSDLKENVVDRDGGT